MARVDWVSGETRIQKHWVEGVGLAAYSKADKSEAVFVAPQATEKMFIESSDGGWFIAKVGAASGTYSDDGGSYCGTVFIPTGGDGSSAWVRDYQGRINVKAFGVDGDGIINDLTAIAAMIAAMTAGETLEGNGDEIYNFGDIAGDAVAIEITKDIIIDWGGAKLLCAGNNGSTYTSTTLFKFTDCKMNMTNYSFEDSNFLFAGPSRGVIPASLRSTAASVSGHRVGKCHIIKGQSILTCTSGTPATYRASDIELVAPITADESYYGLNCAKNGDNVKGSYFLEAYNRLIFVYDVDDINVDIHGGGSPSASSAALNVNNYGSMETSNINIRAVFDELNGLLSIQDIFEDTGGAGIFRNIDIDATVKTYGSNLPATSNEIFAIGTNGSGGWETASTITLDNIKIDFKSDTVPDNPYREMTNSPNYGVIEFKGLQPSKGLVTNFTVRDGDTFHRSITGSTLSTVITAATQANPVQVTSTAHGFATGDAIPIYDVVGMTEINDIAHTVTLVDADNFTLDGVDGTGYTAYTSAGTAHNSVSLDIRKINNASGARNFGLDVIVNGSFNTAFSGQKTVIERQSVHGYQASSTSNVTISGSNQVHQSKTGGDTPTIHFLTNDRDLVTAIKGYTTLVGEIHIFAKLLR